MQVINDCQVFHILSQYKNLSTKQKLNSSKNIELETRFVLCREKYEEIEEHFDSSSVWDKIVPYRESHDFFFDNKSKNKQIRATIIFNDEKLEIDKTYIYKTKIQKICYEVNPRINIVLSSEESVKGDDIPIIVKTDFMRIKQRKSFFYSSSYSNKAFLRYDFTRSWESTDRTKAEFIQRNEDPKYEIEIEFIFWPNVALDYMTESFKMKIDDIRNLIKN